MHAPHAQRRNSPIVRIVDDDSSVRDSLVDFLRALDFKAVAYESPRKLMEKDDLTSAGCIILDVRLSGANGLEFQAELQRAGIEIPIIIITGHGDIPMSVRAMKAGAVDFLTKPFGEQDLIDAVSNAMERDQKLRQDNASRREIAHLYAQLTPREREVMSAVVQGRMNKHIAADLKIQEVTVKLHRSNVMRKMEADSLADLVRKSEALSKVS